MEWLLWVLVFFLIILGFVGLIVPVLPDVPLLVAGFAVYHFLIDGGEQLGTGFWITTLLVAVLLMLVDYISSSVAVKKYGGSTLAVVAAVLGVLTFPFIIGPIGIIVGPFLLVFLMELVIKRNATEAFKVAYGTLVGFLGGIFVKFLVMLGLVIWFSFLVIF
ncbi:MULTISPECIES: DUF456 domain-containing protein [Laceyella]|uniref:DUF456 domain-containing protein n=1 Tax=Laceyella sediminis TaxID=573074 RepID=A0ABX5EQ98_9BACL|nr:DUF456 family protein [Laceyella sediminis]KPC70262.1 hypothetical protein ADL26_17355 [Thermoactinomyces vulgaris]MRG28097.1 DUF456 family protein [Laceyella tengchongensis]PRZ15451.1 hypothetical protein CLV36_104174 [Laceyella sediminis]